MPYRSESVSRGDNGPPFAAMSHRGRPTWQSQAQYGSRRLAFLGGCAETTCVSFEGPREISGIAGSKSIKRARFAKVSGPYHPGPCPFDPRVPQAQRAESGLRSEVRKSVRTKPHRSAQFDPPLSAGPTGREIDSLGRSASQAQDPATPTSPLAAPTGSRQPRQPSANVAPRAGRAGLPYHSRDCVRTAARVSNS